jgi:hypothetical protein
LSNIIQKVNNENNLETERVLFYSSNGWTCNMLCNGLWVWKFWLWEPNSEFVDAIFLQGSDQQQNIFDRINATHAIIILEKWMFPSENGWFLFLVTFHFLWVTFHIYVKFIRTWFVKIGIISYHTGHYWSTSMHAKVEENLVGPRSFINP